MTQFTPSSGVQGTETEQNEGMTPNTPNAPLTAEQAELMSSRIFVWLDTLAQRYQDRYPNSHNVLSFTCDEPGKRYVRIVQADAVGTSRSVHAFYEPSTGNVYKAAGWKAPAKGVRFNLLDDESFDRMIAVCDWPGAYLYAR